MVYFISEWWLEKFHRIPTRHKAHQQSSHI